MSIRSRIGQERIVTRTEIEHGGDKYLVVGSPDANLMADTLLLRPDQVALMAKHWTAHTGQAVDSGIVAKVAMVHKTLQPCFWDQEKSEWTEEQPYDITDIAVLAQKEGPLFLKLVAAAFQVLGLTEESVSKGRSTFDEVASGNLETQAGTS